MTENFEADQAVILVVDDETMIADTMTEILKRSGYHAFAVYDAESALEAVLNKPPQMVIADVSLPGMNGIELGISIRRIFPDCKVVLTSGHSRSGGLLANALSSGNDFTFLQKPVPPRDFLAFVAENLRPVHQD